MLDNISVWVYTWGMEELLKELAESNKVLVAGSYARGKQHEGSDIDFQVRTPKHCIIYGGRNENIDFVINLLEKYKINWESTRNGYISTIGSENDIPIQMEFYTDFHRNRDRIPEVEIMGIKFKTY